MIVDGQCVAEMLSQPSTHTDFDDEILLCDQWSTPSYLTPYSDSDGDGDGNSDGNRDGDGLTSYKLANYKSVCNL